MQLSLNENPFGPSPRAIAAMQQELPRMHRYPFSIAEFQQRMRAENVIVARPFAPLLEWCRISIGTPEEMAVAHAALRKVLARIV